MPGCIAAKLAYPDRKVVTVTGDAGFLMNSQEIETALRVKTPFVVLDFVKYAESFGAKGYRIEKTEDLLPTLKRALADTTVAIIDCPVDYSENMKLTERLKTLKSPL